jgi:hypothetical protein
MRKPMSMILEDNRKVFHTDGISEFTILQVKNSTQFIANDVISKSEVDRLIQSGWDITIKPKK